MTDDRHDAPSESPKDPSRRSFLRGVAGGTVTAVGAAGVGGMLYLNAERGQPANASTQALSNAESLELNVNGKTITVDVPDQRTLLLTLREDLGLTGTKKGCNMGQCGACTVLVDDNPVYACFMLTKDAVGHDITTLEGLGKNGKLHPVQQGFINQMGSQCGMCTNGMIMSGAALLANNPAPTQEQVRFALSGVLCRCGNYPHEVAGVMDAAGQASGQAKTVIPADSGLQPPFPDNQSSPQSRTDAAQHSSQYRHLGRRGPALDGYAKATGQARYAGDIGFHSDDPFRHPLYAKVLRSPTAHARVVSIDDSAAQKLPGYRGMITWKDVPNYDSQRHFLNQHARYCGDAVAAIAADDQYTAQQALKRIRVDWQRLPIYADAQENLKNGLTAIHKQGPVAGLSGPQSADQPTVEHSHGDVEQNMKAADNVIQGQYTMGLQCHVPIEPHCCTAVWKGNELSVWDSQQSVFAAQEQLATVLGIKPEQIRVSCEYLGGGFGGKCTDTTGKTLYQGIAATLARKTGQPVRLEYTLNELTYAEDTRNPFVVDLKTGMDEDGNLTALDCRAVEATGGYASSGPAVNTDVAMGILASLEVPARHYVGYSVYTNSPVGGEMRGFGGPQSAFPLGVHMDKLAEAAGMDPVEFNRKNIKRSGDTWTQQGVTAAKVGDMQPDQCLKLGAEAIGWDRRQPPSQKSGRMRRGLGMYTGAQHSGRSDSDGLIWLDGNGKLHMPIGTGNIGSLAHTGIAAIAAQALDVSADDIDVTWADTKDVAWTLVTDASRACHCDGKSAYNAAQDLRRQLKQQAADAFQVSTDKITLSKGQAKGPNGESRDFRSLAAAAQPRTDLQPYYDAEVDQSPELNESTGKVKQKPSMSLKPQTQALAKHLAHKGGLVGLGHYVFNPSTAAWGATFAEVEVDMETGQVHVLKLVGTHDVGRVLYVTGAEAQVYGGAIMSMGYGMTEALDVDPVTHVPLNPGYLGLKPMTALDYPQIVPIFIETPSAAGAYGAKGLGENTAFGAAPAIVNAVYNATGVRIDEIPLTTERVYDHLQQAKS